MIRLFLVCVCAYELTNANGILSETSDYDDVQHDNRFSGLPSRSSLAQRKAESVHRNEQIYIGFVNNPFGPSKLHEKNPRMNISTSQSKVSPIKAAHEKNTTISKFNNGTQEERPKRGVIDLFNMVSCATGCNPWIYNGYGCYCGLLGSGVPVDGIDRCCKWHDQCYNNARCPMFLEYFMPYYWTCFHHRPLCGKLTNSQAILKALKSDTCTSSLNWEEPTHWPLEKTAWDSPVRSLGSEFPCRLQGWKITGAWTSRCQCSWIWWPKIVCTRTLRMRQKIIGMPKKIFLSDCKS